MITTYAGQSDQIAEIFDRAVHEIASTMYPPEQIAAWAPRPIDYERWRTRCNEKQPFVYLDGERVCGFLELDPDGHIDCHYVHPEFHRRGIGGALLEHAIGIATESRWPRLYVEASHIAKGLYLKHQFRVVRPNRVERRGVTLENWIMERTEFRE